MKGACKPSNESFSTPNERWNPVQSPADGHCAVLRALVAGYYHRLIQAQRGIDLTSGQSCLHSRAGFYRHSLYQRVAETLPTVLAVPLALFQVRLISLIARLSRPQLKAVLQARGIDFEDRVVDVLTAPPPQKQRAVFTLSQQLCREWWALAPSRLVAVEPDTHALRRYAISQRLPEYPWLIAMPHQSTLYWPTAWPWAYHSEPLTIDADGRTTDTIKHQFDALQLAIRRAGLFTENLSPQSHPLVLAGESTRCRLWQQGTAPDQGWLAAIPSLHPIAAGAAIKSRRRWV